MIQRQVLVKGRVQGVGFRLSLLHEADKYENIRGYVRNLEDGSVEVVLLGEEPEVLALIAWCRQGSPRAKVTKLEVKEVPIDLTLGKFDIR